MNSFFANANLATYVMLVIGGIVIVLSIWMLITWLFFPQDPLRWNTEARLEAATAPAALLAADQAYRQQRFFRRFFFLIVLIFVLYQVAPAQTQAAWDAIVSLVGEVFRVLRSGIESFSAAQGG